MGLRRDPREGGRGGGLRPPPPSSAGFLDSPYRTSITFRRDSLEITSGNHLGKSRWELEFWQSTGFDCRAFDCKGF